MTRCSMYWTADDSRYRFNDIGIILTARWRYDNEGQPRKTLGYGDLNR